MEENKIEPCEEIEIVLDELSAVKDADLEQVCENVIPESKKGLINKIIGKAKEILLDKNRLRAYAEIAVSYGIVLGINAVAMINDGVSQGAWAAAYAATGILDGDSSARLSTGNAKPVTKKSKFIAWGITGLAVGEGVLSLCNGANPIFIPAYLIIMVAATKLGLKLIDHENKRLISKENDLGREI